MFLLNLFALIIVAFSGTVCAALNQTEPRIILGTPAKPGEFPYQVSIQLDNNFAFCGGSIIDEKHVVTAAHCVYDLKKNDKKIKVWTGGLILQKEGKYTAVKNIFVHDKYNNNSQDNDIAVLRLEKPLIFNNITNAIGLPFGNVSESTVCYVSGWGDTKPSWQKANQPTQLLYAQVKTYDWNVCKRQYLTQNINLTKSMMCAGDLYGHDACQGDSGGPLACKINPKDNSTSLVGVVSFGIGCGISYYPGVYTNVFPFVDWIKEQQKRNAANTLSFNGIHPLAILSASILYTILFK